MAIVSAPNKSRNPFQIFNVKSAYNLRNSQSNLKNFKSQLANPSLNSGKQWIKRWNFWIHITVNNTGDHQVNNNSRGSSQEQPLTTLKLVATTPMTFLVKMCIKKRWPLLSRVFQFLGNKFVNLNPTTYSLQVVKA